MPWKFCEICVIIPAVAADRGRYSVHFSGFDSHGFEWTGDVDMPLMYHSSWLYW